jgi:hypothetical protein
MSTSLKSTIALTVFAFGFASTGCQTNQKQAGDTIANPKSSIMAVAAASGDPVEWKIPPRPADEMKQVAALEELTKIFRATYASERARFQQSQSTVILFRFSGATLFRNGKIVETSRVIPSEYHNLRYAAHIQFMLFLKLNPLCGAPMDAATRNELQQWITVIKNAEKVLENTGLNPEQIRRQKRMFADATTLLQSTFDAGKIEAEQLRKYARSASIDIEKNMREAGAAQVDGIHRQLLKWRPQIPDSEWNGVCFVVRGPQQPRGGHAATLYLSALLKDAGDARGYEGESTRLIYREDTSLPTNGPPAEPWEADLQLLAAIGMDAIASEALFSDPNRLAVDIASDGARQRIRKLDLSPLRTR